jgi:Rho GTPase-activating protein 1
MDDAREQFNRFRDSMQPRLSNIQGRLQTVPDRLHGLPQKLDNFPRPHPSPPHALPGSRPLTPTRSTLGRPQRAPALTDPAYNRDFAVLASKILYRSGQDPVSGGPLLILCAAAFPDANQVDYNMLLPYVLSNLPGDDELGSIEDSDHIGGYSVVFFTGGGSTGTNDKKGSRHPTWAWTLQAYHLVGVIVVCQ